MSLISRATAYDPVAVAPANNAGMTLLSGRPSHQRYTKSLVAYLGPAAGSHVCSLRELCGIFVKRIADGRAGSVRSLSDAILRQRDIYRSPGRIDAPGKQGGLLLRTHESDHRVCDFLCRPQHGVLAFMRPPEVIQLWAVIIVLHRSTWRATNTPQA